MADGLVGATAGVLGLGIMATAGLMAMAVPFKVMTNAMVPPKKSKPKRKKNGGSGDNSMMNNWEKTWM